MLSIRDLAFYPSPCFLSESFLSIRVLASYPSLSFYPRPCFLSESLLSESLLSSQPKARTRPHAHPIRLGPRVHTAAGRPREPPARLTPVRRQGQTVRVTREATAGHGPGTGDLIPFRLILVRRQGQTVRITAECSYSYLSFAVRVV